MQKSALKPLNLFLIKVELVCYFPAFAAVFYYGFKIGEALYHPCCGRVSLFSYLFGNILAISGREVYLSLGLSLALLLVILLFYNDLFSATFDQEYAKLTGVKTGRINLLLTSLTAVTVVLAIKVVGVMLVSALLILPAVTALQLAKGFRVAMLLSVLTAVLSVIAGITLSFFLDLPAGATIVMCNVLFFSAALAFKKLAG